MLDALLLKVTVVFSVSLSMFKVEPFVAMNGVLNTVFFIVNVPPVRFRLIAVPDVFKSAVVTFTSLFAGIINGPPEILAGLLDQLVNTENSPPFSPIQLYWE